jgi:hypothetical protein
MPLDINWFREEKGGDVKALRASNRARNKPVIIFAAAPHFTALPSA